MPLQIPDTLIFWRNFLHAEGLIGVLADGVGYGNISMRAQTKGICFISGTQTGHIFPLGAEGYSLVRRASVPDNHVWSEGPVQASSESMSHIACYLADEDIHCVMHIHHATLWRYLLDKTPITDAAIPYGTPEMALALAHIVRKWPQQGIVAAAGHTDGIFLYGNTPEETFSLLKPYEEIWSKNNG